MIHVSPDNLTNRFHEEAAAFRDNLTRSGRLYRVADRLYYCNGGLIPLTRDSIHVMRGDGVFDFGEGVPMRPRAVTEAMQPVMEWLLRAPEAAAGVIEIHSHVRAPAFRIESGVLIPRPLGYDARDRVLCTTPTPPHPFDPNFPLLKKLWSGLLFESPVYHDNLLAFTCAMFARTACRHFPFLIFTGTGATGKSMGKTTGAQALAIFLTGAETAPLTYSGSEDELEKRLATLAGRPGPNLIFFDNVRGKRRGEHSIHSQTIAQMTSGHVVMARALYQGPVPLFDSIPIFTMNGARAEADLADRLVQIMLTLPQGAGERPILVDGIHLPEWVLAHRLDLLAEVIGVLTGLPLVPQADCKTRMYDFERIALAAGRRLGLAPDFGPAAVHTCDAFAEELVNLLDGEPNHRVAAASLPDRIRAEPNFRDLNWFLESTRAGKNTLARKLLERLSALDGKQLRTREGLVYFTLEDDPVLHQRVLAMRKE